MKRDSWISIEFGDNKKKIISYFLFFLMIDVVKIFVFLTVKKMRYLFLNCKRMVILIQGIKRSFHGFLVINVITVITVYKIDNWQDNLLRFILTFKL